MNIKIPKLKVPWLKGTALRSFADSFEDMCSTRKKCVISKRPLFDPSPLSAAAPAAPQRRPTPAASVAFWDPHELSDKYLYIYMCTHI